MHAAAELAAIQIAIRRLIGKFIDLTKLPYY